MSALGAKLCRWQRWLPQFADGLNYLIDIDEAVIVDVEATPARTYDEVAATKTMLDRTEACFDLKPKRREPVRVAVVPCTSAIRPLLAFSIGHFLPHNFKMNRTVLPWRLTHWNHKRPKNY